MPVALILVLMVAAFRIVSALSGEFANFAPLMALAFCGAIYLPRRLSLPVLGAALLLSDLILNFYYNFPLLTPFMLPSYACYAAAFLLGLWVARHKSLPTLFGGAAVGSLLFYVITNTFSFWFDAGYAQHNLSWSQAMITGLPGYAPTWTFFRSSLISDLLFTGVFAGVCEWQSRRADKPAAQPVLG
jgi:ABC-type cobalamin transport system permease subunit